ncbi:MAG: lytic transglycosylase domain-containing protein [Rubellimicrobium sp.]|nr:lytic transglycosylase domain-containing protein [Rubellimicrobium sp.]
MRRIVPISFALALAAGGQAHGQTDRLQPDFTFRRVTVPEAGANRRITVQIDPQAPSALRPPAGAVGAEPPAVQASAGGVGPAAPAMPRPAGHEWFWSVISPRAADSGPGRLEPALRQLANAPPGQAVAAPRMQSMQDIARAHGTDILRHTVGTRVSPALVLAVISVESSGRADAVSSAGAAGLMQLMPATAERFGVTDRMVTSENIRGGVAYLDWLMGHLNGDPILVLAAYNAGEGNVRDHGGVPPFAETRGYVPKVLAAWTVARGLCQTPPMLVSDGCVFAVNNL